MSKRMLIDARHSEETRVTVVQGNRVEEFDYESAIRRQLKGNIYLARVTRVEPSLQAAFVEYGGNRHGFLAFNEIHPDYYQIPLEDREALMAELAGTPEEPEDSVEEELDSDAAIEDDEPEVLDAPEDDDEESLEDGDSTTEAAEDAESSEDESEPENQAAQAEADRAARQRTRYLKALRRRYSIQEVIKKRQVLLIQVVKEERGNKGAALTTYLSLAGRYCVLMPNSTHSGGISRKISSAADRKRLKTVINSLKVPTEMGLIIRTAGTQRTKTEIKRDYEYLVRLWNDIRELTLQSVAPALIYEEADLIKRTIRDLYAREIDEVLVEGEDGYRAAKDFMKLLMPSHAKKVQNYKDRIPLFQRYQVESALETMYHPTVQLKSGGYVVINPTEALISIDVNSGRATREHNIEETAYKTNLEAAEEVARQLRLRDMAGLVVIDFIDMEERSNIRNVEKRMKEVLKSDRARIQVGRISSFGLMELSRQRLRPNLLETSMVPCSHCQGTGFVKSTDFAALSILRLIEEEGIRARSAVVRVITNPDVAIYLLNNKRTQLMELETEYHFSVEVVARSDMSPSDHVIERETAPSGEQQAAAAVRQEIIDETVQAEADAHPASDGEDDDRPKRRRRRRRRRRGERDRETVDAEGGENAVEDADTSTDEQADPGSDTEGEGIGRSRRRRGRRGGRRQRGVQDNQDAATVADDAQPTEVRTEAEQGDRTLAEHPAEETGSQETGSEEPAPEATAEEKPKRSRRRRAAKKEDPSAEEASADADTADSGSDTEKPRRRVRRKKSDAAENVETVEVAETADTPVVSEPAPAADSGAAEEEKPKRTRRTRTKKTSDAETPDAADGEVAEKPKRARRTRKPKADSEADPATADTEEKPKKATRKRKPKASAETDDAAKTDAAPPSASDAPNPAPEPAPEPAPAPQPQPAADAASGGGTSEPEPERPKRKGWWQRTFG